jgi:hypothetical protein
VDDEVNPYRLLDHRGAVIVEYVHGQYRVEKLPENDDDKE